MEEESVYGSGWEAMELPLVENPLRARTVTVLDPILNLLHII